MGIRFWIVPALAGATVAALALSAALAVVLAVPRWRRAVVHRATHRPGILMAGAFLPALAATAGSLYLSEGLGLLPCELCWYQRIAMYPLVVVLGVGLLRRDHEAWRTALPLAVLGGAISLYHVVLQLVPQAQVTECAGMVPCTARYFAVFGFVSIPVMAGAAFLLVILLLVLHARAAPGKSVGITP